MKAVIVGGRLQGVEAAYLARKAGWETILIDKAKDVPAKGLANTYFQCDATDQDEFVQAVGNADLIIPALEDGDALSALVKASDRIDVPLAYDPEAYRTSSSKTESNRLFDTLNLPRPLDWPGCGFPVVVKPDGSSGSKGVRIVENKSELSAAMSHTPGSVIQAFTEGPSFSIEVAGLNGQALPLVVTDIHLDPGFDCKRVTAPTALSPDLVDEFAAMAAKLAEAMRLTGIMDLEAILSQEELKLLEIDARLPSQTPTAVYWSTRINIVEILGHIFVNNRLPQINSPQKPMTAIYEHLLVANGRGLITGEHIMSKAGTLELRNDFYGADEALTDYRPGLAQWRATMIFYGDSHDQVWARRNEGLSALARDFSLTQILDPGPGEV